MSMRQTAACNIAPLFLRLALGVTFLWAGLAKVMVQVPVSPEQVTQLAELGVVPTRPFAPTPPAPPEVATPPEDAEDAPADDTPTDDTPTDDTEAAAPPAPEPLPDPADPSAHAQPPYRLVHAAYQQAIDDDAPQVMRLHAGITLLVRRCASPAYADDGTQLTPILPSMFAQRPWPVALAWAAVVAEIGGGVLVLLGFFTRLGALSLAGTMAGAAWMTQIGPAIQKNDTWLGFIPTYEPWWDPALWSTPLWQLALLCAGLALVFTGAGALSIDRLLFRPRAHTPHKKK